MYKSVYKIIVADQLHYSFEMIEINNSKTLYVFKNQILKIIFLKKENTLYIFHIKPMEGENNEDGTGWQGRGVNGLG